MSLSGQNTLPMVVSNINPKLSADSGQTIDQKRVLNLISAGRKPNKGTGQGDASGILCAKMYPIATKSTKVVDLKHLKAGERTHNTILASTEAALNGPAVASHTFV